MGLDVVHALIVRAGGEMICNHLRTARDQGAEIRKTLVGVRGLPGPKIRTWGIQLYWSDVGHPPAHRDKAAMNGAQLLMAHGDSSRLMNGPPAFVRCGNQPTVSFREEVDRDRHSTGVCQVQLNNR